MLRVSATEVDAADGGERLGQRQPAVVQRHGLLPHRLAHHEHAVRLVVGHEQHVAFLEQQVAAPGGVELEDVERHLLVAAGDDRVPAVGLLAEAAGQVDGVEHGQRLVGERQAPGSRTSPVT
jgi:hypothetical protein